MLDQDGLHDLISGIYDAGLDQAQWPRILGRVRGALGGNNAALAMIDARGRIARFHMDGADPQRVESYGAYYHALDPVFHAVMRGPAGKVWSDEMVQTPAQLRRTEFHADWARSSNMSHVLQAVPATGETLTGFVAIARPSASAAFSEPDIRLSQTLLPHIGRAIGVQLRLERAISIRDGAMQALDRLAHGVFFVDSHGLVFGANKAAEASLGPHTGLRLRAGVLSATTPEQTASLRRLIAEACAGQGRRGQGGWLRLDRADLGPALRILAAPAGERPGRLDCGDVAALLLVDAGPVELDGIGSGLGALFGLTQAEAAVAVLSVRGQGAPSIATALRITHNTVRSHLRRVFDKTGARTQAELGVMVARLPASPAAGGARAG